MSDDGLRDLLLQLSPSARDKLRAVLIREDRDEIASEFCTTRRQRRRVGSASPVDAKDD